MENREYKYDAFISYRHCELDKFVAENLHKILETYELPRNIKKKLNIKSKTFKRVFRDQEELPLSSNLEDPIVEALKDSKYLIVICSPRLKYSLWCQKEIQTFKKLRGRKNIFCVLIEGEPSDSFPDELLYDEQEKVLANGKVKKEKIMVEPLAADVRGKDKKEVLKKIKIEKLRLVAPMYNLDYDDLRQRHKVRKLKRIIATTIIVAVFSLLFAIYSLAMFIKINVQQNILAKHQALSLAAKSEEYLKLDKRYDAIKAAFESLTEFEYVEMPYTPEAEYALVESLGIYDIGSSYKAISEIKTKGVADYIKSSDDNKVFAVYDESEEINLYSSKTLDLIATFKAKISSEEGFSFVGNDILSFINEKGNISLVSSKDGKLIKELEKEKYSYYALQGDVAGEYLVYSDLNNLYIYNVKESKVTGSINSKDKYLKEIYFSEDGKYIFVGTTEQNYDVNKEEYLTIHVIKVSDAKEINSVKLNAGYISGILTKGDNAYLLLNRMVGAKYNMLIVSYDFINGNTNWSQTIDNNWGKYIIRSYPEGTNNIAVANYQELKVFDASNGGLIESFSTTSEIINMYSYLNKEMYLLFLRDGSVNFINMEHRNSVEYMGKFEFNLEEYNKVAQSEDGFLLIPTNENRVILYEEKFNEKMKQEDIEIENNITNSISISDYDKIKEEYDVPNKNLVNKMFYDTDKKLLFVNYKNEDLVIYSVSDKQELKILNKLGKVDTYLGKDKNERIYIGDISNSYILDKNYDKVGHVKGLRKLEKDKLIISDGDSNYYSLKIYTLDELKEEASKILGVEYVRR